MIKIPLRTVALGGWLALGAALPAYASPPSSEVTSPPNGSTVSVVATILGTAQAFTPPIVSVSVSVRRLSDGNYWNGASWSPGQTFNASLFIGDSSGTWNYSGAGFNASLISGTTYLIESKATDGALPQAILGVSTFTFDTTSPIVNIAIPMHGASYGDIPVLYGNASDNVNLSAVTVNIQDLSIPGPNNCYSGVTFTAACPNFVGAGVWPSSWSYVMGGGMTNGHSYLVSAKAFDMAGNISFPVVGQSSNTFTFTNLALSGNFNPPGLTVFGPGSWHDIGNDVAVDTITPGGPWVYTLVNSNGGANPGDNPSTTVLLKHDFSGVLLSSRTMSANFGIDAMAIDHLGNIYMGEKSSLPVTGDQSWLTKLDKNLIFVSSRAVSRSDVGNITRMLTDGVNIYTINDGGFAEGHPKLIKYSPTLVALATAAYNQGGLTTFGIGDAIARDNNGDVYVIVSLNSSPGAERHLLRYNANSGTWNNPGAAANDTLISALFPMSCDLAVRFDGTAQYCAGYDAAGTSAFIRRFNGAALTYANESSTTTTASAPLNSQARVRMSPDGNVVVAYTNNSDAGVPGAGRSDYEVAKFDANLGFVVGQTVNGPSGSADQVFGLAIVNSTDVYVTGTSSTTGSGFNALTTRLALGGQSGGQVFQQTTSLAPVSVPQTIASIPMLKIGMWTQGPPAQLSSILLTMNGNAPATYVNAKFYKDDDNDATFQSTNTVLGSILFGAGSPPQANVTFANQTITNTTQYFFVGIDLSGVPPGSQVGVTIDNPSRFGLSAGAMANQAYPLVSGIANAQLQLYANPTTGSYTTPTANPSPSGGFDTGLYVYPGQNVVISASGLWDTGEYGMRPATGTAGQTGGLDAAFAYGALVGRFGGSNWFQIGSFGTFTTVSGGELYLAMSDSSPGNSSGQLGISFQVLASTVAKVWTGAFNQDASVPSNWQGGNLPVPGDTIKFDGSVSNQSCFWDIYGASLGQILMFSNYTGSFILSSPGNTNAYNTLNVSSGIAVDGGTFVFGNGYRNLSVQGLVSVKGGTLDMGTGGATMNVGTSGIVVKSSGTFQSIPNTGTVWIGSNNTFDRFPFTVQNGTVNVNGSFSTSLSNVTSVDLSSSAKMTAFNNVQFFSNSQGYSPSLVLHSGASPIVRNLNNTFFDVFVSSNVDASDVVLGSVITMNSASGQRMGSPFEKDPNSVVFWNPDGGGTADVSGNISNFGTGSGSYHVRASTSPFPPNSASASCPPPGNGPCAHMSQGGGGAYNMNGLTAPNTWYFLAWRDSNSGGPGAYAPRAGYQNQGVFESAPVFLSAGASQSGINFFLADWGVVPGYVSNVSGQTGNILVRATYDTSTSTLRSPYAAVVPSGGGSYSLDVSSGDAQIFAFVDVNGNGVQDSFEAWGSSMVIRVLEGNTYNSVPILVTGGSTPPGGVVIVSSAVAHLGFIGDVGAQPMLRLTMTATVSSVTFNNLRVDVAGTPIPTGQSIGLWRDDNGNGRLDMVATSSGPAEQSIAFAYLSGGVSSTTLFLYQPETLLAGQSRTYFLTLDTNLAGGHQPLQPIGLSIGATNYFGLSQGDVALQGIYPISTVASVYYQVMAFTQPGYNGGGGYDTMVFAYPGQQVTITSTGSWFTNQNTNTQTTPAGIPGTENQYTVVPGARVGALLARIGGNQWVAVGTGTTLSSQFGGSIGFAMNDLVGDYFNNFGSVYANFSVAGSTTGVMNGTIGYTGTAVADTIYVRAAQVPPNCDNCPGTIVSTVTVSLTGGTTFYPFVISQLLPGDYIVSAFVASNPNQQGSSGRRSYVAAGSTVTVNFPLSLGVGTLSGSLSYGGPLTTGNFFVGVTTSSDFQHDVNIVAGVSQPSAGVYTINNLPTPNVYYVVAFRDGNSNGHPDGPEPLGFFSSSTGPLANLSPFLTPVFIDTGATVSSINVALLDRGGIIGNLTTTVALGGASILAIAGHKTPGDPSYTVENIDFVNEGNGGGGGFSPGMSLSFQTGLLRPATDYSIVAFADFNNNKQLDPGEPFGVNNGPLSVPSGGFSNADIQIKGAAAPSAVTGFSGAPLPATTDKVQWTWNAVQGATGYFLLNVANSTVAVVLGGNTTFYVDTVVTGNTASAIRKIQSANAFSTAAAFGFSPFTLPPVAPVASLAATPGSPTFSNISQTSMTVSWTTIGNAAGTFYNVGRSSVSGGVLYQVASTSGTSVTDFGLLPGTAYFYRAQALNLNGSTTTFSAENSAATVGASGPSLAGSVTYPGAQKGPIVVQAFTTNTFTGAASAQVLLPSPTAYYMPVAANTYFLRAFIDVNGDGLATAGEDLGVHTSTGTPATSIVVAGPVTGKNVAVPVRTTPTASPFGLLPTVSFGRVDLTWSAPTTMANGTPLVGLAGYRVQRATYPVAGTGQQFYTLTNQILFGVSGLTSATSFADLSPIGGVTNIYRVVAVDFGGNQSSPSSAIQVQPSVGGTISGSLQYYGTTPSGLFHVRLSTSPNAGAVFAAESNSSVTNSTFAFAGLPDGNYFLSVFRDLNSNFQPDDAEPAGTHGGVAQPFPIPIINGNVATNRLVNACDRTAVSPSATPINDTLSALGCPALDQGPGFYTNIYSFRAGGGGAGSVGVGSTIRIQMSASFGSRLILLGPNGDMVASSSDPNGAVITHTISQPGLYLIEPTSFNSGTAGSYTLTFNYGGFGGGGYGGAITGTISYSGSQTGTAQAQLFTTADTGAFPIAISTLTLTGGAVKTGAFTFGGLPDGQYYLRGFRDSNGNFVQDSGEPFGSFGVSNSSLTTVFVQGGVANPSPSITLIDPAVGTVSGQISRLGTQSGTIRIEIGTAFPNCTDCSDMNTVAYTTIPAAGAFNLPFVTPATDYIVKAWVDVNSNSHIDPLEAYASSSPVTVQANATTTVNLLVQDPGTGAAGSGSISGTISYAGASTGPVFIGFATDPKFNFFSYVMTQASVGAFSKTGILGGTSYYIASFVDVNNNGQPEFEGTSQEPIGFSTDSSPIFLTPTGSSTGVSIVLEDPPSGSILGQISYAGATPGNIVIQAESQGGNQGNHQRGNFQRISIPRSAATAYPYTLPFLAASSSFTLSAFVDANGNGRNDFGEPYGYFGQTTCTQNGPCVGSPVTVSSGAGTFPTYGISFFINDPGSTGGNFQNTGATEVHVVYMGTQSGPIVVRLFDNANYTGVPVRTISKPFPPGPGQLDVFIDGLALGTYYLDAFRDTSGAGYFNPTFNAYARLGSITLTSYNNRQSLHGEATLVDPGQGGSVNAYTGNYAAAGGARFDGGATDIAAGIAIDTVTAGGPYTYVEGITKQNAGIVASMVRLSSAGVFMSSATIAQGTDIGPFTVDTGGNVYFGRKDETLPNEPNFLVKLGPALNPVASVQITSHSWIADVVHHAGFIYVAVEGNNEGVPIRKINPASMGSLLSVSSGTFSFPASALGNCFNCTDAFGQRIAVDPVSGNVYAIVSSNFSPFNGGQRLWMLLKFGPSLGAPLLQQDVTGLIPGNPSVNLAADSSGNVFLALLPDGDTQAHTYKFTSSLQQVASVAAGPVYNHFSGGLRNLVISTDNYVYEAWESQSNAGDFLALRYDNNLNLLASRTFDGANNALEDFAFSIAVHNSSNVYLTGCVNNGQNLDWATIRVNMNSSGATSGAGQAVVITTATATSAIFGSLTYNGALVTSGTVRGVLLPLGSNVPVRLSSAAFGANTQYLFNNVPPGFYKIQAFIDVNSNLSQEAGEPYIQSAAAGFQFNGSSSVVSNLKLCDRRPISVGVTINDSITASDCISPDRGGAYQRMYNFQGTAGQIITIQMDAVAPLYATNLNLYGPDGTLVASDDHSAGNSNAKISVTLPGTGLYTVGASPYAAGAVGPYRLTMFGSAGSVSLGSISGNASYTGSQGGRIQLGLFNATTFSSSTFVQGMVLPGPGAFAFNDLATGTTYYVAGFVDVNGNSQPDNGENIGFFGSTVTGPSPIYLRTGQSASGINFIIDSGTNLVPVAVVTGLVAYPGCLNNANCFSSNVRVEFWASGSFTGQPVGVRSLLGSDNVYFDIQVPGGTPYYLRAYLDINGNARLDPGEPFGVYTTGGYGATPVQAPSGSTLSGINITMQDPGLTNVGGGTSVGGEGTALISSGTAGANAFSSVPVPASTLVTLKIGVTAGTKGLRQGGQIQLVVPPSWPFPQTTAPAAPGYTTIDLTGIADAKVTDPVNVLLLNGPAVSFKLSSGTIAAGEISTFTYKAVVPCQTAYGVSGVAGSSQTLQTFSMATAQGTGNPADFVIPQTLFNGSPYVNTVPGGALYFNLQNGYFALKQNQVSDAVTLSPIDGCGNPNAKVLSGGTLSLRAQTTGYNAISGSFVDDVPGAFGFALSTAGPFQSPLAIGFGPSSSTVVFFTSAAVTTQGSKNIAIFVDGLGGPTTYYGGVTVVSANLLSNVSVSTVPFGVGSATATIIPNGDPSTPSQAFINFSLSDPNQNWHVLVSSVPFKAGVAPNGLWESWGYGQPARGQIAWDGRYSPWVNNGSRVPSGLYYVRVEVGNGVRDDSVGITVQSPQLSGVVYDGNTSPLQPVPGVSVRAYGPFGGGSAQGDSNGAFIMPGLAPGGYQVYFQKNNYVVGQASVTIDSLGNALSIVVPNSNVAVTTTNASGHADLVVQMFRAPTLVVIPTIASTSAYDLWGNLQVADSSFSVTLYSGIHLPAGTTTFDDGGQWDPSVSSFVTHTAFIFNVPQATYSVKAEFASFQKSTASIFVPSGVTTLTLSPFIPLNAVSGGLFLHPTFSNTGGVTAWISAVPSTTTVAQSSGTVQSGFASLFLPPGMSSTTYTVPGLANGKYMLTASAQSQGQNLQNLGTVSTGPVTIAGASVFGVDFSTFQNPNLTNLIIATVTVTGPLSNLQPIFPGGPKLRLNASAWAPNTPNFGSKSVDLTETAATVAQATFSISGLTGGTTYQFYAFLDKNGDADFVTPGGMPVSVFIPLATGVGSTALNFEASSGVIKGTILLPPGAHDFGNVSLFGKTVASARPQEVGHEFQIDQATGLPNFSCLDGNNGSIPSGLCPTTSTATFLVNGISTETDDISLLYKTTGLTRRLRISIVSGSTTTVFMDLSSATYSIAGAIINQISTPTYNTNAAIKVNAPTVNLVDSNGTVFATSTARVVATQVDPSNFSVAISTVFRPAVDRFAYLNQSGEFFIPNVPSGVYFVHTEDLRSPSDPLTVIVPRVGKVVSVSSLPATGADLTLNDGYAVSGNIALENELQDSRIFKLTVLNGRQEVVRSTTVLLGDGGAGIVAANSVNFSFNNLPGGQFYTLKVEGTLIPVRYAGRPIKFPDPGTSPTGLQSNLSGQNVLMQRAAYIMGRLKDANSGVQITAQSANMLAPNFRIAAIANPWVEGGFVNAISSVAGRPILADGTFLVGPLIPSITYDLSLKQDSWDLAFMTQGSQNYTPVRIAGLQPTPGQLLDVGIIALAQGQSVTGSVKDSSGTALGNIKITASPSFGADTSNVVVQTFSGSDGRYTLWVSTSIASRFDLTAAPRDGNVASNGKIYAKQTLTSVDLATTTSNTNFILTPLLGAVTGQIVTADGGALSYPFYPLKGFPAAAVFLQPAAVPAEMSSPLGSIEVQTDSSGNFEIPGLSTGAYILRAVSQGYKIAQASVTVSLSTTTGVATFILYQGLVPAPQQQIVLARGGVVSGRILKADPTSASGFTAANGEDVGGVAAVNATFTRFVIGSLDVDPNAKTINSYSVSGFETGQVYSIVLLPPTGDDVFFPAEGANVSFGTQESTTTKNINLTFISTGAVCAAGQKQIGTLAAPKFQIKIVCNKNLRNKTTSDNDIASVLTKSVVTSLNAAIVAPDGQGALAGPDNGEKFISDSRRIITAIYTPAALETQFSLRLRAFTSTVDPKTGVEFAIDQVFDFKTGLDNHNQASVSNVSGGSAGVEPTNDDDVNGVNEDTHVDFGAGAFINTDGSNPSKVLVGIQRTRDTAQITAQAIKKFGYVPSSVQTMTSARALPDELYGALRSYQILVSSNNLPPAFSAFYRIFLPAGVLDQLKNPAVVTLSYNLTGSSSTTPGDLNIWHFVNTTTCSNGSSPRNGWCLENSNRTVDTVNKTISASVNTFSTFAVFASTPVFQIRGFTGNSVEAFNFPNPSDCSARPVTINNPAGGAGTTTLNIQGPMIRVALPGSTETNSLTIKVFNVAGELVRTIDQGAVPGGTFNYTPWDCTNDGGRTIASGVYFGVVKWGGHTKVFKMAIIKGSGL